MGIPMSRMRRSWDRLFFNTAIHILGKRYLYIETGLLVAHHSVTTRPLFPKFISCSFGNTWGFQCKDQLDTHIPHIRIKPDNSPLPLNKADCHSTKYAILYQPYKNPISVKKTKFFIYILSPPIQLLLKGANCNFLEDMSVSCWR